MLKSATFVEKRRRALPGLAGALLLTAAGVWMIAASDDARALLGTVGAFILLVARLMRLAVPNRLILTNDYVTEEIGPISGRALKKTPWIDVGPVSTNEIEQVHFMTHSDARRHRLYTYGVRGRILAALMNDLRLDTPPRRETKEAAERALVTPGEVYLIEGRRDLTRQIEPTERSLTMPPEATGEFLLLGETDMSHDDLIKSVGGRTTTALVEGQEQDVYFHLGEVRLTVIAFVEKRGGCDAFVPMGAELAASFWAAHHACEGRFATL